MLNFKNITVAVPYTFLLDWLELHNDDHYFLHSKVYHPTLLYENVNFNQLQVKVRLKENINFLDFSVSKLITCYFVKSLLHCFISRIARKQGFKGMNAKAL